MRVGLRFIEWFGIGLAFFVTTMFVVLSIFPLEHTRVRTVVRDTPPIQEGIALRDAERHFHFGHAERSGSVPGGNLYEFGGPGWRAVFFERQPLNHALPTLPPGHPLEG